MIRTRFAPSPTGFLHLGGARTALFSWAFARRMVNGAKGKFVLRIEDTDLERSTQEAVDAILNAFAWLKLQYDEGPYYQTQHFDRYREVAQMLVNSGHAYYCYCSKEELDEVRQSQMLNKEKPKYNGKCRHLAKNIAHCAENSTDGFTPPHDHPVIRFKNPTDGSVSWKDLVKGEISINNSELDDLIIVRSDGTPTYNFCVVVDDMDMKISHVIRGDDHVNNTPRQINILQALSQIMDVMIPQYAHLPMILDANGDKMSKRKDAVDVMQYKDMGILPDALLNYLARLCWAHGNDEIFSMCQFVEWFDLSHISASAARFDMQKLLWVNSEKIKLETGEYIYDSMLGIKKCTDLGGTDSVTKGWNNSECYQQSILIIEAIKHRHDNLLSLAAELQMFYTPLVISDADRAQFLNADSVALVRKFVESLDIVARREWSLNLIKPAIKEFCTENDIKMPQLAIPMRLMLCGVTQTVSLDMLLWLLGYFVVRDRVRVLV